MPEGQNIIQQNATPSTVSAYADSGLPIVGSIFEQPLGKIHRTPKPYRSASYWRAFLASLASIGAIVVLILLCSRVRQARVLQGLRTRRLASGEDSDSAIDVCVISSDDDDDQERQRVHMPSLPGEGERQLPLKKRWSARAPTRGTGDDGRIPQQQQQQPYHHQPSAAQPGLYATQGLPQTEQPGTPPFTSGGPVAPTHRRSPDELLAAAELLNLHRDERHSPTDPQKAVPVEEDPMLQEPMQQQDTQYRDEYQLYTSYSPVLPVLPQLYIPQPQQPSGFSSYPPVLPPVYIPQPQQPSDFSFLRYLLEGPTLQQPSPPQQQPQQPPPPQQQPQQPQQPPPPQQQPEQPSSSQKRSRRRGRRRAKERKELLSLPKLRTLLLQRMKEKGITPEPVERQRMRVSRKRRKDTQSDAPKKQQKQQQEQQQQQQQQEQQQQQQQQEQQQQQQQQEQQKQQQQQEQQKQQRQQEQQQQQQQQDQQQQQQQQEQQQQQQQQEQQKEQQQQEQQQQQQQQEQQQQQQQQEQQQQEPLEPSTYSSEPLQEDDWIAMDLSVTSGEGQPSTSKQPISLSPISISSSPSPPPPPSAAAKAPAAPRPWIPATLPPPHVISLETLRQKAMSLLETPSAASGGVPRDERGVPIAAVDTAASAPATQEAPAAGAPSATSQEKGRTPGHELPALANLLTVFSGGAETAEQALQQTHGAPGSSQTTPTNLPVLLGIAPQVLNGHPFVRLPRRLMYNTPRSLMVDINTALCRQARRDVGDFITRAHHLLSKSVLTPHEMGDLASVAEELITHAYFRQCCDLTYHSSTRSFDRLGLRFVILDIIVSTFIVLGQTPDPNAWRAFTEKVSHKPPPIPTLVGAIRHYHFYGSWAHRISLAIQKLKRLERPDPLELVNIKRVLFCANVSPLIFKRPEFDAYREDDRKFMETIRRFSAPGGSQP
ncbi:hypothetical protein EMWEY_00015040 [Eimeria maxima]|uniref:Uncharacterized protein n=1 Tax=Eimeria maxima TaxID=5804 RepID=U6M767_EIMMA|nr:hypothetical protein EMWEY_00015040 [Eimeria maxima]CDJ58314.1 hypothetical protein EMWEY_00015040 [Eimeria maxima]